MLKAMQANLKDFSWVVVTPIVALLIAGFGLYIGVEQFKQQSKLTREMFEAEFKQNREIFVEEAADRRDARMVRAWQLLKSSVGETGNVGQITALETLYKGGEDLRRLTLVCLNDNGERVRPCTFLAGVDLGPIETGRTSRVVNLSNSDLSGAVLVGADLSGAVLELITLSGANLINANLSGANLFRAILTEVNPTFSETGLTEVNLNLTGAYLKGADLTDADLTGADLTGADLTGANFKHAKGGVDLSGSCADPVDPPINLPDNVNRPEVWVPCLSEEGN